MGIDRQFDRVVEQDRAARASGRKTKSGQSVGDGALAAPANSPPGEADTDNFGSLVKSPAAKRAQRAKEENSAGPKIRSGVAAKRQAAVKAARVGAETQRATEFKAEAQQAKAPIESRLKANFPFTGGKTAGAGADRAGEFGSGAFDPNATLLSHPQKALTLQDILGLKAEGSNAPGKAYEAFEAEQAAAKDGNLKASGASPHGGLNGQIGKSGANLSGGQGQSGHSGLNGAGKLSSGEGEGAQQSAAQANELLSADDLFFPEPQAQGPGPNDVRANGPAPSPDLRGARAPALSVQLSAHIIRRAEAGAQHFEIRLDPPALGRVQIRLHIDGLDQINAVVSAERADTLAELMRGARDLEAALKDAGYDLGEHGLAFDLAQEDGRDRYSGRPGRKASDFEYDPNAAPAEAALQDVVPHFLAWRAARLDILA